MPSIIPSCLLTPWMQETRYSRTMRRNRLVWVLAPLLVSALVSCSGSSWGKELKKDAHYGRATMFYTENVDPALAQKVFDRMIEANYNFASNLPEQLDRVDGRLVLRLGNDNEDSIAEAIAIGEESGVISYMHGLAFVLAEAAGGEPVDIILCRESLDDPFYTVVWDEGK